MKRLTGWVRLGLVISTGWALLVVAIAGYEFANPKFGGAKSVFVYSNIAVGTKWIGEDDPWGHDWENDPNANKVTVVRSRKLLGTIVGPIIGGWLVVVGSAIAVRWVREGFNQSKN